MKWTYQFMISCSRRMTCVVQCVLLQVQSFSLPFCYSACNHDNWFIIGHLSETVEALVG